MSRPLQGALVAAIAAEKAARDAVTVAKGQRIELEKSRDEISEEIAKVEAALRDPASAALFGSATINDGLRARRRGLVEDHEIELLRIDGLAVAIKKLESAADHARSDVGRAAADLCVLHASVIEVDALYHARELGRLLALHRGHARLAASLVPGREPIAGASGERSPFKDSIAAALAPETPPALLLADLLAVELPPAPVPHVAA